MLLPSVRLETSTLSSRIAPSNAVRFCPERFFRSKPYDGEKCASTVFIALGIALRHQLTCFTHAREIRRIENAPGFVELHIPKTEDHRKAETAFNWHISADDIINYQYGPYSRLLLCLVKALYHHNDAVVLCHPYMAGLLKVSGRPSVIYESLM